MTTHNIEFSTGSFDQDNTFTVVFKNHKGVERTLICYAKDYEDEGVYIMQRCACLKAEYTAKDNEELSRLNSMEPIRTGDTVNVSGRVFTAQIIGDYSDAGRLIPA